MPIVQISPEAMLHKAAPYVDILRDAGFEIRYPKNPQFARGVCDERETIEELQGVSAVIATAERYSKNVMAALPDLRVIARAGVGYDRVDIPAATDRGIVVTITPTANHEAVAELALALLFAVTKSIVVNDKNVRAGRWPRTPLVPVRGKTLGIFGLGRIGRSMAVRSASLGMRVIATEQFPDREFVRANNIELVDFDTLLARSDFITVHCPLTDETRGLFNRDTFAKMKPGSIFLNTARGPLMVEADLLAALQSGHLRAAGLDVFEVEPPSTDNPLFQLDNVVVAPHIAGADDLSLEKMGVEAAECIAKLYQGQWPDGAVVNNELKSRWKW
jgi:D-3-phosphoglycerate dehydrogenase